ncbi:MULTISPECIES: DUF5694 domain-containing protein [Hyphobacterium]|uniref:DUF5694 domain-containing protein n=1 Tax=Hyphobacterium vulgare TaxID=1736751 RepID=A0ABV6ZTY3_9PROT
MKFTLAALSLLLSPSAAIAQHDEPPAQVMVLGTFHFTGGGQDYLNPEVDDYLAPARQAEIEAVVERLAEFNPTRIVVELDPEAEDRFNALYDAYRRGEHTLTVNERQQIGMRLAARLGHERLYAADYSSGMDFDAMMAAGQANGQDRLMARMDELRAAIEAEDARLNRPEISVTERLIAANAPDFLELHNIYLTLAQLGSVEDPAGAREMTNWWGRNLQIFAQISWIAEPGERVLVIYGSGHKFLFDQFIQDAVEMEWVDALDYLED